MKRLPKMAKVEASAVNRAIDRLASFFASGAYRELKRTWVHGDYRLCNVAFDADRVSGLFDWDLLCEGPRLFDVVVASADLARTNAGPLSSNPEMWQEDFRRHLAAYRKEARRRGADMTESEVRSIPYMLLADAVLSGVFFALHLRQLPLKPGESASQASTTFGQAPRGVRSRPRCDRQSDRQWVNVDFTASVKYQKLNRPKEPVLTAF